MGSAGLCWEDLKTVWVRLFQQLAYELSVRLAYMKLQLWAVPRVPKQITPVKTTNTQTNQTATMTQCLPWWKFSGVIVNIWCRASLSYLSRTLDKQVRSLLSLKLRIRVVLLRKDNLRRERRNDLEGKSRHWSWNWALAASSWLSSTSCQEGWGTSNEKVQHICWISPRKTRKGYSLLRTIQPFILKQFTKKKKL